MDQNFWIKLSPDSTKGVYWQTVYDLPVMQDLYGSIEVFINSFGSVTARVVFNLSKEAFFNGQQDVPVKGMPNSIVLPLFEQATFYQENTPNTDNILLTFVKNTHELIAEKLRADYIKDPEYADLVSVVLM
jgi:hypothetical protein